MEDILTRYYKHEKLTPADAIKIHIIPPSKHKLYDLEDVADLSDIVITEDIDASLDQNGLSLNNRSFLTVYHCRRKGAE